MTEQLLVRLVSDATQFSASFTNASKHVDRFTSNVHRKMAAASRSISNLGQGMVSVGNKMTIGLTGAVSAFGAGALKASMEATKLQTSLNILTGSAKEGEAAFLRLQKFSASTPFQLKELVGTNNMLLGFGMNVDDAFESLKMLGDASSATGADLNRVAVAFGQSAATGRAMAGDLNQFVNNGIPIYSLLSKETGKTAKELREMASRGDLSFDILNKAFKGATKEGGLFFGATQAQAETMEGRLSTLKDNINLLLKSYGDLIEKGLKPMVEWGIEIVQRLNDMSDEGKTQVLTVLRMTAVMGPLLAVTGKFVMVMSKALPLITGIASAMFTWPVIIAVVIGVLLSSILLLRHFAGSWTEAGRTIGRAIDFMVDLWTTGVRIMGRVIVLFIGWMGKQFDNLWDSRGAWGTAVMNGLKGAKDMLITFGKWAMKKLTAIFTGSESGTFDDAMKQFKGDTKAGRTGGLLEGIGRIFAEEEAARKQRREGKQIVNDETRQRAVEQTQIAIKAGRDKSKEIMESMSGSLKELVELGKDRADEVGLDISPLGLE